MGLYFWPKQMPSENKQGLGYTLTLSCSSGLVLPELLGLTRVVQARERQKSLVGTQKVCARISLCILAFVFSESKCKLIQPQ